MELGYGKYFLHRFPAAVLIVERVFHRPQLQFLDEQVGQSGDAITLVQVSAINLRFLHLQVRYLDF